MVLLAVFLTRETAKFAAERWLNVSSNPPAFVENSSRAFVSNLLLVHSLGLHDRLTFNEPSWSISAEFYAYILFGVVVLAMRNWLKPAQLAVFATISALSFGVLLWSDIRDLNILNDFGWFRYGRAFSSGPQVFWYSRDWTSRVAAHCSVFSLTSPRRDS